MWGRLLTCRGDRQVGNLPHAFTAPSTRQSLPPVRTQAEPGYEERWSTDRLEKSPRRSGEVFSRPGHLELVNPQLDRRSGQTIPP